jgi:hypothetical protein
VQCTGKSDRLFDLSNGFRAVHLSSSENHSCVKFVAEDFNRPSVVACFKMVKYQAIFENGINARLLGKLTEYTIIMFRRNVDQYFHGRTIDRLDFSLVQSFSCMMARIVSCFGDSVKE